MSYDVHITRAEEWSESETAAITLEEWIAYARSDPELRIEALDGRYSFPLPDGEVVSMNVKGLVAWLGKGDQPSRVPLAWFSWSGGIVSTKNPDIATRRKMFAIATSLHAKVEGDEGEIYDANGAGQPGP
jgi:hypothetical protein